MQKEITYTGIANKFNGHSVADGTMSELMNLVPEVDGLSVVSELRPADHGMNELVCVHHLPAGGMNYIYRLITEDEDTGTRYGRVYFRGEDISEPLQTIAAEPDDELNGIDVLGNTLVLRFGKKISYLLWRANQSMYEDLGTKPPQSLIQFGIKGVFASYPDNSESKQAAPSTWKTYENSAYDADGTSQILDGWIVWNESFYKASFPCDYTGYKERKPYDKDGFSAESLYTAATNNDDNDDNSDTNGDSTTTIVLRLTNLVMGAVNKFVTQQGSEKNRFVMPFLVRYAYRMFDGTHIMHSAPVLLIPNSKAPVVWWRGDSSIQGRHSSDKSYARREPYVYARVSANTAKLMVRYISIPKVLHKWRDVIQGIDIYVSQPLYTYEQDKPVYGWEKMGSSDQAELANNWKSFFCDGNIEEYNTEGVVPTYGQRQWYNIQSKVYSYKWYQPRYRFILKERSESDIAKDVKTCSTFFKVSSIDIKDLVSESDGIISTATKPDISTMQEVKMEEGVLNSLTSQEQLDDDYKSHYDKSATATYIYNNRLNIGDVSETVNSAANNCEVAMPTNFIGLNSGQPYFWKAVVELVKNGKSIYVRQPEPTQYMGYDADFPRYVFVPDVDARRVYLTRYLKVAESSSEAQSESSGLNSFLPIGDEEHDKIVISDDLGVIDDSRFLGSTESIISGGTTIVIDYNPIKILPGPIYIDDDDVIITNDDVVSAKPLGTYAIDLEEHEFLNGAVWFKGYNNNILPDITKHNDDSDPMTEVVNYRNKIYTSNADNPFKFSAENINTIGTGKILAMRAAVTPVRSNQVGQLSMYAFSEDGIWALKVSSDTGGWSGWEIVNGDVLSDPSSVCQLSNEVAYITNQGVKIIQGSQSSCISTILDGLVHGFDELMSSYGQSVKDYILGELPSASVLFAEYVDGAGLAYDYTNERLICYNPGYAYYYVYDIKASAWGCVQGRIVSAVSDYPQTLVNLERAGNIAELTRRPEYADEQRVMMVTRPLKLDGADVYKTITALYHRGDISMSGIDITAIFGSRNLKDWVLLDARKESNRMVHGSGCKYFKIMLVGTFKSCEKIVGASIDYEVRAINRIR